MPRRPTLSAISIANHQQAHVPQPRTDRFGKKSEQEQEKRRLRSQALRDGDSTPAGSRSQPPKPAERFKLTTNNKIAPARSENATKGKRSNKSAAKSQTAHRSSKRQSLSKKTISNSDLSSEDNMAGAAKKRKLTNQNRTSKTARKGENSSVTEQSSPTQNSPRRSKKATEKQGDLPFHPDLLRIRHGDLSMVPRDLEVGDGPKGAAFKRLYCGKYTEGDEDFFAWMYPTKSTRKDVGWKVSLLKIAETAGGPNQLSFDKCQFIDALKKDVRFLGEPGKFRPAQNTQDLINTEYMGFLLAAYYHNLPDEEDKVEMSDEGKSQLNQQATARKRKQELGPSSEGIEGEEDEDDGDSTQKTINSDLRAFMQQYNCAEDVDIWTHYNEDTMPFDLTKLWVCNVIARAWSGAHNTLRSGPPADTLRAAMRAKRANPSAVTKCSEAFEFLSWDRKERGEGGKTVEVLYFPGPPTDFVRAAREGNMESSVRPYARIWTEDWTDRDDEELAGHVDGVHTFLERMGHQISIVDSEGRVITDLD